MTIPNLCEQHQYHILCPRRLSLLTNQAATSAIANAVGLGGFFSFAEKTSTPVMIPKLQSTVAFMRYFTPHLFP